MTKIENQTLSEMVVILDDHVYIDCQFDKCTIYFAGGPCILVRCKMRQCATAFLGAAHNTMSVLATLGMLKQAPEFQPGPVKPN